MSGTSTDSVRPADAPRPAPSLAAWNLSPEETVSLYLETQENLTPVDRFSRYHGAGSSPSQGRYYRELIPAREPGKGEQYAFEVDMDRCTGCKGCVTACHNLNGLLDRETWRQVGLLRDSRAGGDFKFVTTSCHHCAIPGCAQGCPVDAYEKLEGSGVVKHLDDQCIGCQYCTWTCPYEAPQYQPELGIVRKCDLCITRLEDGEAPACVQACPNQAIRVVLARTEEVMGHPEAFVNLPDAPDPALTRPATRYVSTKPLPETMTAGDRGMVRPEPYHWPVLAMLFLTQTSFGAFLGYRLLGHFAEGWDWRAAPFFQGLSMEGLLQPDRLFLLTGIAGIFLSLFHLGRPHLAFRAVLGWRHSWLSREILVLGAWMAAAGMALVSAGIPLPLELMLHALAAAGIFCSAQVYRKTPRELWRLRETYLRFFGHALTTGVLLGWFSFAAASGGTLPALPWPGWVPAVLALVNAWRLGANLRVLRWEKRPGWDGLKRSARIQGECCASLQGLRLVALFLGGVLVPGLAPFLLLDGFISDVAMRSAALGKPALDAGILYTAALGFACLLSLAAELAEKALFFRSGCGPKMPGGALEGNTYAL